MQTIVALASGTGRAGIGVIRVSGPSAWEVCLSLTGKLLPTRKAALCFLRDEEGDVIDQALVLLFDKGKSFTSEKIVEFHVHGSPAVVGAVLSACLRHPDVRTAKPGEFTRRAYDAGNLSVTQVEGLADLIDSDTEQQRKLAIRMLRGDPEKQTSEWRGQLVEVLAWLEACIDFSDEDIPADLVSRAKRIIADVERSIASQVSSRKFSERVRDGYQVAIIGRPNVGKSTLLNALAGREAALTSQYAGTTRDVIEVKLDMDGYAVSLIDTAGVRETTDPLEKLGIEKGLARAAEADLRVYLKENPEEIVNREGEKDLVVLSKCDVWGLPGVSGKSGEGVDLLINQISERLRLATNTSTIFSRERHFENLSNARDSLCVAISVLSEEVRREELAVAKIREAVAQLDSLVGNIDAETVLGRIFSSFCIGK